MYMPSNYRTMDCEFGLRFSALGSLGALEFVYPAPSMSPHWVLRALPWDRGQDRGPWRGAGDSIPLGQEHAQHRKGGSEAVPPLSCGSSGNPERRDSERQRRLGTRVGKAWNVPRSNLLSFLSVPGSHESFLSRRMTASP